MQVIVSTGEDGKLVAANADNLSGGISATQTLLQLNYDTFDADDIVIIDQERIELGVADGSGSYAPSTRGAESTTKAIHASSSNVFLKGGTEVLTHTFDGSTMLASIRVGALERDAVFGLSIDMGVGLGDVVYRVTCNAYSELEKAFPFRPYTPASGVTIQVLCWTFAAVNVSAVMES